MGQSCCTQRETDAKLTATPLPLKEIRELPGEFAASEEAGEETRKANSPTKHILRAQDSMFSNAYTSGKTIGPHDGPSRLSSLSLDDRSQNLATESSASVMPSMVPFPQLSTKIESLLSFHRKSLKKFKKKVETENTFNITLRKQLFFMQGDAKAIQTGSGYCRVYSEEKGLYFEGFIRKFDFYTGLELKESGSYYFGGYKKGRYHGFGEHQNSKGEYYKGLFSKGKRHGNGELRLKNGDVYRGSFKGGQYHGDGHLKLVNGDSYRGEFKNGVKDGYGKL